MSRDSKHRVTRFAYWTVVALAAGVTTFVGWRIFSDRTLSPIVVDEASLNFGNVWVMPDFHWRLRVHNPNGVPVRVRSFRTSCTCSAIRPENLEIGAHADAELSIDLDLTPRQPGDSGAMDRPFEVSIVPVFLNRKIAASVWSLSGNVRVPFVATPPAFAYGGSQAIVKGEPTARREATIECRVADAIFSASVDPQFGVVEPPVQTSDGSYVIGFTPRHDLPTGNFNTSIVLTARDSRNLTVAKMAIPVSGVVIGKAIAIPSGLQLGRVAVGDVVTETVALQNTTGTLMHAVTPRELGRNVVVSSSDRALLPGSRSFNVRISVEVPGDQRTVVKFGVVFEDGTEEVLTLPVSYYAVREVPRE